MSNELVFTPTGDKSLFHSLRVLSEIAWLHQLSTNLRTHYGGASGFSAWADSELARLTLLCANPDLRKFLAQLFGITAVVRCQVKRNHLSGFPSLREELGGPGVEKPPEGHHCYINRTRLHESPKARVGVVCIPEMGERFSADRNAVSKIRCATMPQTKSLSCCGSCANLRWRSWFRPQCPHSLPETVGQHRSGFRCGRKYCCGIVIQET